MKVWIFQDDPAADLIDEMNLRGIGRVVEWNIDRYFRTTTHPHIECDDIVLAWRPKGDDRDAAAIVGCGYVSKPPFYSPNVKSDWQTKVTTTQILNEPITKDQILATSDPDLRELQIFKMPGGHIVFRVTETQWKGLQGLGLSLDPPVSLAAR